jgi:hypothetical protein
MAAEKEEAAMQITSDRLFILFLRLLGGVALLATFCVAFRYTWMDAIHGWLGMGKLPSEPVVGYLARSTSAFYAMFGGLLWLVSYDPRRYRPILLYLGVASLGLGLTLWVVDWVEGLPPFWRHGEGPLDIFLGVVILWGARHVERQDTVAKK